MSFTDIAKNFSVYDHPQPSKQPSFYDSILIASPSQKLENVDWDDLVRYHDTSALSCQCLEQGRTLLEELLQHQQNTIHCFDLFTHGRIFAQTREAVKHAEATLDCECGRYKEAVPLVMAMMAQIVDTYGHVWRSIARNEAEFAVAEGYAGSYQSDVVLSWLANMHEDSSWGTSIYASPSACVRIGDYVADEEETRFIMSRLLRFRLRKVRFLMRLLDQDTSADMERLFSDQSRGSTI